MFSASLLRIAHMLLFDALCTFSLRSYCTCVRVTYFKNQFINQSINRLIDFMQCSRIRILRFFSKFKNRVFYVFLK